MNTEQIIFLQRKQDILKALSFQPVKNFQLVNQDKIFISIDNRYHVTIQEQLIFKGNNLRYKINIHYGDRCIFDYVIEENGNKRILQTLFTYVRATTHRDVINSFIDKIPENILHDLDKKVIIKDSKVNLHSILSAKNLNKTKGENEDGEDN